jgi:hypothetical protein
MLFPKAVASLQREAIAGIKPRTVCACGAVIEDGDPRLYPTPGVCSYCEQAQEAWLQYNKQFEEF